MTPLTYASLCSGIEAAHLALTSHRFTARWFSDIDPFACALLAHHYPDTPNHGDMRTLDAQYFNLPQQRRWDTTGNLHKARCLGTEQRNDVRTCNFIIGKDGLPRTLTPLDNYTQIPWRGKPAADCPDTPRYKAIGNAWPVPVIHWLGQRLAQAMTDV